MIFVSHSAFVPLGQEAVGTSWAGSTRAYRSQEIEKPRKDKPLGKPITPREVWSWGAEYPQAAPYAERSFSFLPSKESQP